MEDHAQMKQEWLKTSRIEAISDGVFAIAMTLLVLELKLPDLEGPVASDEFNRALLQQGTTFLAWFISFAILCRLWITQHALLTGEEKVPRGFVTYNFIFLGAVSFIPFPTSLISGHYDQPMAVVIFSATYVVAGLALGGMLIQKDNHGEKAGESNLSIGLARRVIIGVMVTAVAACLLSFIDARLGLLMWIVFPFVGFIWRQRKAKSKNET